MSLIICNWLMDHFKLTVSLRTINLVNQYYTKKNGCTIKYSHFEII